LEDVNPFDVEFEENTKVAGMSSPDMQRRIYVLGERTKYLLDLLEIQRKDIAELKKVKASRRSRAKKVTEEE